MQFPNHLDFPLRKYNETRSHESLGYDTSAERYLRPIAKAA